MAEIAKDLSVSLLFDFYGALLTQKQCEVIDYYYNQDLSLAEIASLSNITRQGVRDSIKRAEKQLVEAEERLGLYKRFHEMQKKLEKINKLAWKTIADNKSSSNLPSIEAKQQKIIELTNEINT